MKSPHGSKGFTLVEILVALVILSVSLLALAGLMVTTTRNNASGGHVTEAATLAQDKLEELRVTQWDRIVTGQDAAPKVGSTGVSYTRNWSVEDNANIKTITITVNWMDRIRHSISLLSVISQ